MSYFFITADTENNFYRTPQFVCSSVSRYSGVSAILANESSICGPEVGTSTIDVFKMLHYMSPVI